AITPRTDPLPVCTVPVAAPGKGDAEAPPPPLCLLRGVDTARLSTDLDGFEKFSEFFVRVGEHWSARTRRLTGALLVLGTAVWLLVPWLTGVREVGLLERPLRWTFSVIALLTALWLFTIPDDTSPENRLGYVKNMLGRALWFLLATYLLGEIVWALAGAGA